MTFRSICALSGLLPWVAFGQALNPLAIPPLLATDTLVLVVDEHTHQFYPGITTPTYGVNGPFLGPTLLMQHGDTAHIRVENHLDVEHTSMHWHGMQVPGECDGGPQRVVIPGESWSLAYEVKNPAGTFWYHPHPHEMTAEQVNMGLAGMIIVQDEAEAALELPRTYGVDDVPLVIQDRRFLGNGQFAFGPFGDSVLVNGTAHPYIELPAQLVRLRLLNGSNARIFQLGFADDRPMTIIGNDGGLLDVPIATNRVRLCNGERSEVLLDLSGMEGDSLLLMSHATELPSSMPGSSYILWESSALSGIDFPVLRIRVTAPTPDPVTTAPSALVPQFPPDAGGVSRTRYKSLSGTGMVGMGMFTINGLMFDMDVINDTMVLGATEEWLVSNASNVAHPFHIHGGSFWIISRDGQPPHPWEQGAKDMVLVDVNEEVRIRMRFDERTNGWPFMYHCHNLLHEDNMMMLQYIVEDATVAVNSMDPQVGISAYPSPAASVLSFTSEHPLMEARLFDLNGHVVRRLTLNGGATGQLAVEDLSTGPYVLELRGEHGAQRRLVMKE